MKEKKEKKKLKVAFPHMGTVYIAWSAALRKIGVEPFIPPYTSKRSLSLGTKHSPEAICLPYKLVLGNMIEAIEGGADYVAMISSPGTCRMGEYSKGLEYALAELGYSANFIEFQLYEGLKGVYNFLCRLTQQNNPFVFLPGIYLVVRMIFALDKIEKVYSYYRAREVKPGSAEKVYKKGLNVIAEANSGREISKISKEIIENFKSLEIDKNREVLHVDITGEIFVVLDQFSNQDIEKELGRMGVEVHRSLTISGFIKDALFPKFMQQGETHIQRAFRLAEPYLKRDIGGDAIESVSDVAYAKEKGKDGLIHLSPFTCMPEIMSQNIFPSMREDIDIPVLPLILDEQTGRAGYITRLEAFVDLMRRKKRLKQQAKLEDEKSLAKHD